MDRSAEITKKLLQELFSERVSAEIGVRLWDGTCWPDSSPRKVTLVLNHPGALRQMFLPGNEVGLAEAYLYNDFDIEGDVETVYTLVEDLAILAEDYVNKIRLGWHLLRLPRWERGLSTRRGPARLKGERHSIERDR